MLNPTYPRSDKKKIVGPYCLDSSMSKNNVLANLNSNTGPELRLQSVYGDEIWLKLQRAGFSAQKFETLNVLEPCAGTGFLTYHLLQRCRPKSLTVNDISSQELEESKVLLSNFNFSNIINWVEGDMHKISFNQSFDLIIGNSFLHHFHNVGKVLLHFANLLNNGGSFISLHEPTTIASVVESGKLLHYPFAVMFPELINDIIRYKHKGDPDPTDIWMFEKKKLEELALNSGFSKVRIYPWNLARQIFVAKNNLHLNKVKPKLLDNEVSSFKRAINFDSKLNRFLPSRFFGSLMMVCEK
jgi:ubiquinone/menaquinone biosynthesis C-methylase UbiE